MCVQVTVSPEGSVESISLWKIDPEGSLNLPGNPQAHPMAESPKAVMGNSPFQIQVYLH